MKEIKWIKGNEVKPYKPYDYPEGYENYFQTLIEDLHSDKALGVWEEKKTKIPKELHRRRWIVGEATFTGEKGTIHIRFSEGEFMPLRTHNWIMKNDSWVKRTIRSMGGN